MRIKTKVFLMLLLVFAFSNANAQEQKVNRESQVLEKITVSSSFDEALREAGSSSFIEGDALENQLLGTDDIHRVLRQTPGVNIQEEDGYGLRPNISFRGVQSLRSSKITLMEDGILIAPAPYSAPAAYYFPPVGRMSGVEVTKGPGQIKYGPYTTGGALNLLSTPFKEEDSIGRVKFGVGNDNLRKLYTNIGQTWKHGAVLFETYQFETDGFKEIDGGGDPSIDLEDYQFKFRLNTDRDRKYYQELEYKFGIYDQNANETYLGLTDDDFGRKSNRRYAASQLDNIDADHIQHHIRHFADLEEYGSVATSVYYNQTQRNWRKLGSVNGTSISDILENPGIYSEDLAQVKGANSARGAFSYGNAQREFDAYGVQTAYSNDFELFGLKHDFEAGARYHYDEEDRFQNNELYSMNSGRLVLDSVDAPGSNANRISSADAWAFYIQDNIELGSVTFSPGLRYEMIDYEREDYGKNDPNRTGRDLTNTSSEIRELVPGASLNWELNDEFSVFAGVHKGFSPPGPGRDSDVKEEQSVNYELGYAYAKDSLYSKMVFFYTDYDNLLGADTLAAGGEGTGDLFNGGQATVVGLEAEFGYDLLEGLSSEVAMPIKLSYTLTDTQFDSNFDSDFFGNVNDGDPIPYIPENQVFSSIGLEYSDYAVYFEGFFNQSMPTAAGGSGDSLDTDSFMVFDLAARWNFKEDTSLFVSVENLFDSEYVVARRPSGARPGLPLTAVVGLEMEF